MVAGSGACGGKGNSNRKGRWPGGKRGGRRAGRTTRPSLCVPYGCAGVGMWAAAQQAAWLCIKCSVALARAHVSQQGRSRREREQGRGEGWGDRGQGCKGKLDKCVLRHRGKGGSGRVGQGVMQGGGGSTGCTSGGARSSAEPLPTAFFCRCQCERERGQS